MRDPLHFKPLIVLPGPTLHIVRPMLNYDELLPNDLWTFLWGLRVEDKADGLT